MLAVPIAERQRMLKAANKGRRRFGRVAPSGNQPIESYEKKNVLVQ
jgi:hypothetical protein